MAKEENKTPNVTRQAPRTSNSDENGETKDTLFTPRFRSVAAMAGWDEEALLLATLVVEDTPDRESKHKKRINPQFKSPPTSSRRRKRVQRRRSPAAIPMVVLDLENDATIEEDTNKNEINTNNEMKENVVEETKKDNDTKVVEFSKDGNKENEVKDGSEALIGENSSVASSGSALPCMNRLREELSCAICLDICFEPSTTSCGHSFCKKCLKSAADKCGKKCPKCRQLISNGRSCTVNTVLWNTIQLLFPQEVESRKAAECVVAARRSPPVKGPSDTRYRSSRPSVVPTREVVSGRRRRDVPTQADDEALALTLQREEYMMAPRGSHGQGRSSFTSAREVLGRPLVSSSRESSGRTSYSSARENLRAMASRAVNLRVRRA